MKKLVLVITVHATALIAGAQTAVSWTFTAKKVADRTYEVRFSAAVDAPWHIYSQYTPEGGPLPTTFSFAKNPLVQLDGKMVEKGRQVRKHEEVFGIDVIYFDGNVEFVQIIKLKANARTTLSGSLQYMACNESQCLPPATVQFNIVLK